MEEVQFPKYPCPFCKREEATQLCDYVIDYAWTSAKDEKGRMIGAYQVTCDNHMCKKCAMRTGGLEMCPVCQEIHQHVKMYVKMNHRVVINRQLRYELLKGEGSINE